MKWLEHYHHKGLHAFLSPSNYHWVNYSFDKLKTVYFNKQKIEEGTKLHSIAADLIERGIKLSTRKQALNYFVNDSINYGMKPEQVLFYSDNCFGTADAIKFDEDEGVLYIFDLKTGSIESKFTQLDIYAALFCLEYGYDPRRIKIIERIYQFEGFKEQIGDQEYIFELMNIIIDFDSFINEIKEPN